MILDQDLRRVTDINTCEVACWPSFALKYFSASSDGVTCYTCDCILINAMHFGNKKWGGQKTLRSPTPKNGGTCPPVPPLNSVHAYNELLYLFFTEKKINQRQ